MEKTIKYPLENGPSYKFQMKGKVRWPVLEIKINSEKIECLTEILSKAAARQVKKIREINQNIDKSFKLAMASLCKFYAKIEET